MTPLVVGRPRRTRHRPNKLSNYVMSCLIVHCRSNGGNPSEVRTAAAEGLRMQRMPQDIQQPIEPLSAYETKHPGVDDTQSVAAPTVVAVVRDESAFKPKLHSLVAALTPDFMESNFTRPVGELVDQVRCGAPSFSSREAEILVAAAASAISGTATLFQKIATLDKANDPTDFCSFRCMITTRPMALTHCFKLEVFLH